MKFISTRNKDIEFSASEVIVKGLSDEGGLFVPCSFPTVTEQELKSYQDKDYYEISAEVISKFLTEFSLDTLKGLTKQAYDKFDGEAVPITKTEDNIYFMELWHGPTHAFKDIALTLLPLLLSESKKINGITEKTLILVATSGDTGKAALEGFKDTDGTDIIVFYPEDGVSALQKLQMKTQRGNNVRVFGIKGNFDDAQNAVKRIFTDGNTIKELKECGYALSSANSINFGRLVPQIAYYFSSYAELVANSEIDENEKINFCVPCGNFGNILAGYYAKKMGLPINKLICASNKNNVLTDFINKGEYSLDRKFYKTTSPSMDIIISSNLERLIFELSDRDDKLTAGRMEQLKRTGSYNISNAELEKLKTEFYAEWSDEEEILDTIGDYFDENGYIIDTHTAVSLSVYNKYVQKTGDNTKTVIVSTASPYKFVGDVLYAIGEDVPEDEMDALELLEEVTALPLPESLSELPSLEVLHSAVIDKEKADEAVIAYVKEKL